MISPQLWGVEKREVHSGFRFSMPLLVSSAGLPVLVASVPAIGGQLCLALCDALL